MHPAVAEVQNVLRTDLKRRFITEEREGHMEDLLISTMLDPRFKHFVFPGATQEMRVTAEKYFRAAYDTDWSPEAIQKREEAERLRKEKEEKKAKEKAKAEKKGKRVVTDPDSEAEELVEEDEEEELEEQPPDQAEEEVCASVYPCPLTAVCCCDWTLCAARHLS